MATDARILVGLTGGIGSGKSTVSAMLAARGAGVIDTDRIARQLSEAGGAAIEPVASTFGREFIGKGGALDRARMRALVFAEPGARQRLEAIFHPLIGAESRRQADASRARVIVFDVPLLVESAHWRARVDEVWVIDCSEATQIARVGARSGWDEAAVRAVIASQATRSTRRAAADVVIDNDTATLAELDAVVDAAWNQRLALAGAPSL